jgi:urate oxidase
MKILRDGETHHIKELDVAVMVSGDFASSYTSGDNSSVVPTDTIKNTVNALAKEHLGAENERFALMLARHFLAKYPQVHRVEIEARERLWDRLAIDGAPQPHTFTAARSARPFARVEAMAESQQIESGIADLLILKSTQSGFAGFPRCEFTTLRETDDRIFATALSATWIWRADAAPANFAQANAAILDALLEPFALNYSPSVQTTLFQMGEAALAACAEITRVHLAMPNKHYLLIDLAPFGLENRNEIFVPTDEPHGQIEATITRK